MAVLSFREALGQAMEEEMAADESIFLMGEEVAEYNGAYKVSKGLLEKFGPRRVVDSPISEGGFAGLGVGAAMAGLRPIIEMMTWNFGIQGFDQIINHAAKMRYMSGGQFKMPIVYRGPNGCAHMLSSQHSQAVDPMITNVPGLKVVCPTTPADGKGLLKAAIRDDNPVIFLESELMYGFKGEVPDGEHVIPLGVGEIKKEGTDVTIITWGKVYQTVIKAVPVIEKELGITIKILDPRTLQPLDEDLIFAAARETHRVIVVEESWGFGSVGAEIAARITTECFDDLDAPVERVTNDFVPMPYNESLENNVIPNLEKISSAVKKVLYLNN